MKTYHPEWSLKTRLLAGFSLLACAIFAGVTVLVVKGFVTRVSHSPPKGVALNLLLPLAFLIGLSVWVYGLLVMLTKRFEVSIQNGVLRFSSEGGPLKRQKEIRLDSIEHVGFGGPPGSAWILIESRSRSYRLGHLIRHTDALEIVADIKNRLSTKG